MKKMTYNSKGATFVELLLYVAIFLVLTPILLTVAVNSLRTSRSYDVEKVLYTDGQFTSERLFNIITDAKRIDVGNSVLNNAIGKLTIINQNDETIIIELNPETKRIEITENSIASSLTSDENEIEELFFEKIPDNVRDPEIAVGLNVRMKMSGPEDGGIDQNYVISPILERGDFDDDGCPDFKDEFPRHASCCGDGDTDGICDELDNCILEFNPFQQDFDGDQIGDHCDASAYIPDGEGGGVGALGAFNCSPDEALIELVQHCPPFPSPTLKNVLLSSSPLSPDVLLAMLKEDNEVDDPDDVDCEPEDDDDILTNGHLRQILINNVKWTEEVYDAVVALDIPGFQQLEVLDANEAAEELAWLGDDNTVFTAYQVEHSTDDNAEPPTWYNKIRFHSPDNPLCFDGVTEKSDIFVLDVELTSQNIDVVTETVAGTTTETLHINDPYIENSQGFGLEYNEKSGNLNAFIVTSVSCTDELDAVEFHFGNNSNIISPPPTSTDYDSYRYTSYCEGGCVTDCGDVGTGIITEKPLSDKCYLEGGAYPEWCSRWYTTLDDDNDYPPFVGGTQEGEATAYWEKEFKTVLTILQLANLKSITVTGEVAFQNITQFFCDGIPASCPMEADLINHEIELYNYNTDTWESIGATGLDGTSSDQQVFEVIYDDTSDILDFFGLGSQDQMKARIKFTWDGDPPGTSEEAPAFMLLDYFTIHLRW